MSVSDPFDLVSRPWLTVRPKTGEVAKLSLVDTFRSAGEVLGLVGDIPTQVFALTRLLLAVLHRAVGGPQDLAQWKALWTSGALPADEIENYLQRHRHRFDLHDPVEPFFQVTSLRTGDDKVSDLSKLIADVPNGHPFFSNRLGGPLALSSAEAARWLVYCQAFDPSGIKSGDPSDPRTKHGKGYPIGVAWSGNLGGILVEGVNLRETLLLNLVPAAVTSSVPSDDLPVWERTHPSVTEDAEGRAPIGPVALYTWQSRRIRLFREDERVTGVLIANGDRRTPQNMHLYEPRTPWRRSQAQETKLRSSVPVYMPLEHNPDRALWRGLPTMLPETRTGTDAAQRLMPTVLSWIAQLTSRKVLSHDFRLSVRAVGMSYGSQNSTVIDITDDVLSLRAVLFAQDAGPPLGTAKQAGADSETAATAVARLGEDLAVASGSRAPAGPKARAAEHAYDALDPIFRAWLARLGPKSTASHALADWHRTADRALRSLVEELLSQASPAAWVGRSNRDRKLVTSAHARKWCGDALRQSVAPRLRPRGEHLVSTEIAAIIGARVGRLQHGYLAGHSTAVAALAQLRRGVGKQPGQVPAIIKYTHAEEFVRGWHSDEPSYAEHAAHTALTLYAFHQQSQRSRMHVPGRRFGLAVRALAPEIHSDVAVKRRFVALATADSFAGLTHYLRGLVQLMRTSKVTMDYGLLARDLWHWQFPDRAARVRSYWGHDFYFPSKKTTPRIPSSEPNHR